MTGMHIGGSEVELVIGGVDNAVVKDKSSNTPYVPGSSLKGKLRDLLGRHLNMKDVKHDLNEVFVLFGDGAEGKFRNAGNLIIRDSFWEGTYDEEQNLEEKSENTIDRVTGRANPRHMERVVRGANFKLEMILDVYENYNVRDSVQEQTEGKKVKLIPHFKQEQGEKYLINLLRTLKTGFKLLENDYLGGSGTRGYGKVKMTFEQPEKLLFKADGKVEIEDISFNFND